MVTELDRDAAQDQQPQDDHEWQVKAAESGRVQRGKSEVEAAAAGEQPNLVAVPERPDGPQHRAALAFVAGDERLYDARAEVITVQHDVYRDHYRDQAIPNRSHDG